MRGINTDDTCACACVFVEWYVSDSFLTTEKAVLVDDRCVVFSF